MADNRIYWLWLQDCLGPGAKVKDLFSRYKDARDFFLAGENVWRKESLSRVVREKLKSKKPDNYNKNIAFCSEHKIYILCPDDEYYPDRLLEIEDFPLVLYVRGDYRSLKNEKSIAVIGSRTPCVYGQKAAEKIVSGLVENDYLIVSGGALGIDSVAHISAINSGGKTVLVMGCGHGNGYLPENSALRKLVSENGALITEYPPYNPVTPGSFPMRNRIISALGDGVVIVEAADPSGTFNTANHALEQNKDVYVLPGDIESGNFAGSNRLITEGAIPVFSSEDILLYCGTIDTKDKKGVIKNGKAFSEVDVDSEFSKKLVKKSAKNKNEKKKKVEETVKSVENVEENCKKKEKNCPEGISKNAAIVYNIMSGDICTVDEAARETELSIRDVLVAVTELEMFGVIENDGPGKYKIK